MIEWYGIAISAVIGLAGLVYGYFANQHASEANTLAADANEHSARAVELAASAEERAERLESTNLESRDVEWEQRSTDGSAILSFQNVGTDTAYDVTFAIDPPEDEKRRTERYPTVAPTQRVGIPLPDLASKAEERARSAPPGFFLSSSVTVRARIAWRSASGIHESKDWPEVQL